LDEEERNPVDSCPGIKRIQEKQEPPTGKILFHTPLSQCNPFQRKFHTISVHYMVQ
jgi:hypothetical protein